MSTELHIDGRVTRAKKLRDARREEILLAAQKIIADLGTAKANVADIIQAAGVSRGTFYLYFDSYAAVLHELTDRFLGQIIENVRAVRLEDGSPLEQLEENLHRVISLLLDHPDLTR